MKVEKVYEVEFMNYTNTMRDTVSYDYDTASDSIDCYLKVGAEPFLVREDHLSYFKDYGGGFRSLRFVGYISTLDSIALKQNSLKSYITEYLNNESVSDKDLHYKFVSDPEGEVNVDNGETNR